MNYFKTTLVFLLLACTSSSWSQSPEEELRELMWGKDAPAIDITEIPEKWKNESAVIIYEEHNHSYRKVPLLKIATYSMRKRIKLLDNSAVTKNSEFTINQRSTGISYGFKVIKPDGKEVITDNNNAVNIDNGEQSASEKIAISGLEKGDILDYYISYRVNVTLQVHVFETVSMPLAYEYPIMKFFLNFQTGKNFYISSKSCNGAPEFIKKKDNKKDIYTLTLNDYKQIKDPRWIYPEAAYPFIKFQVIYLLNKAKEKYIDKYVFWNKDKTAKNNITETDLKRQFEINLQEVPNKINLIDEHLESKNINHTSKLEEYLKEAFYFQKHLTWNYVPLRKEIGIWGYKPDVYQKAMKRDDLLVVLYNLLKEKEIPFDIIVTTPKQVGNLNNALFKTELVTLIKLRGHPIYISEQNSVFDEFNVVPYHLQGCEAYLLSLDKKHEVNSISKITLPTSQQEDNNTNRKLAINMDLDSETLHIKRSNNFTGYSKIHAQSRLLEYYDYVHEDIRYFENKSFIDTALILKRTKKDLSLISEKIIQYDQQLKKEQTNQFGKEIEDDYNIEIDPLLNFEIIDNGHGLEKSEFVYHDEFSTRELIQKAGKNYLLLAGRFIGEQVAIEEKEQERNFNIFMPYARSFSNEIIIKIPKGYEAAGLENFDYNIDNSTGSFISSATKEGNIIIIKSSKVYKNDYEQKENWNKMIQFLDAAYQFSQKKILFKKL